MTKKQELNLRGLVKAASEFLSPHSDRVSVIVAFSLLETMVSDLLNDKSKHSKSYVNLPASLKIDLLHDLKIIDDHEHQKLSWLRKI
jgi:hypothetical protein